MSRNFVACEGAQGVCRLDSQESHCCSHFNTLSLTTHFIITPNRSLSTQHYEHMSMIQRAQANPTLTAASVSHLTHLSNQPGYPIPSLHPPCLPQPTNTKSN